MRVPWSNSWHWSSGMPPTSSIDSTLLVDSSSTTSGTSKKGSASRSCLGKESPIGTPAGEEPPRAPPWAMLPPEPLRPRKPAGTPSGGSPMQELVINWVAQGLPPGHGLPEPLGAAGFPLVVALPLQLLLQDLQGVVCKQAWQGKSGGLPGSTFCPSQCPPLLAPHRGRAPSLQGHKAHSPAASFFRDRATAELLGALPPPKIPILMAARRSRNVSQTTPFPLTCREHRAHPEYR